MKPTIREQFIQDQRGGGGGDERELCRTLTSHGWNVTMVPWAEWEREANRRKRRMWLFGVVLVAAVTAAFLVLYFHLKP